MELSPLPPTKYTSLDGETKAETVKKLHQKAKENLEKKTNQIKNHVDKRRTEMVYKPGDWVWLHMRPERFPNKRKSKLDPRGDGPFRVLEKINDNAYKLEFPEEVKISTTFNVSDLSPFSMDEGTLGEEALQGGENDEDIEPLDLTIPNVSEPPRTRQGAKRLREQFEASLTNLLSVMDQGPASFKEFGSFWTQEYLGPDLESKGFGQEEKSPQENQQDKSSPNPLEVANSNALGRDGRVILLINYLDSAHLN